MGIWVTDEYGFKFSIHEDKAKEFIQDNTLIGGRSLITKLAASHWGYVNKNGFWYDPNTIDGTLSTWTKPYPKPVLTYHPKTEDVQIDPIGRIIGSNYNLGVAREFIEDELIPNNKPHGYIELLTRISDPDATTKILDGRYDTVSISAVAAGVSCSICGANVSTEDSECQHKRFKRYDKKGNHDDSGSLCYFKAGPLCGRHVAFVLTPSDAYAGVKERFWEGEPIVDSIVRLPIELFVLSDTEKLMMNLNDNDSTNIFDQVNDDGRKILIFDMMRLEPSSDDEVEEYIESVLGIKDKKLTQSDRDKLPDSTFCGPDRSFPVPDEEHARAALFMLNRSKLNSSQKSKVRDCVMGRVKTNKWNIGDDIGNDNTHNTNPQDNDNGKEGNNMAENTKLDTIDTLELTEGELKSLVENPEALTEDAKLSYATRKGLPDSAFCGPDRSFPGQDAAHVRNGLARLNQSKGKAKGPILACLRGRAKKYGIKVSTKVKDEAKDEIVDTIYDLLLHDATIDDILALDIVEKYISDNYTPKSIGAAATATQDSTLPDAQITAQSGLAVGDAVPAEEMDKLKKSVSDKDAEINMLNSRIIELTKSTKNILIDRIVDMKSILTPATDIVKLKEDLTARTEASLADTLKDIKVEMVNPTITTIVKGKGIAGSRDQNILDSNNQMTAAEINRRKKFPQLYENK